jgi:antigen 43
VTYYHVELPEHAVILAEGMAVESYLDVGDRGDFADQDVVRLFPDFGARLAGDAATMWETRGAAQLVMAGERLEAVRRGVVKHGERGAANVTGPTIAESSRAAHRARISAAA